jgi:Flp pilus assembly protein TadG
MLRRFSFPEAIVRDSRGSVLPLFGLMVLPLAFAVGLAIDSARGYRTDQQVAAALDAAALATAKALRLDSLTDGELEQVADTYFRANFLNDHNTDTTVAPLALSIDREINVVSLTATVDLPTSFGRLMSVQSFRIVKSAQATYDAKDVELAMMLDVSGSMAGSKLSDLKSAAQDLVDMLLSANESGAKNRIGIAPYSTAVNAGPYAHEAKGSGGNTCVSERSGPEAFSDAAPSISPVGAKASSCTPTSVLPLTDDQDDVEERIAGLAAGGMTAGHLGIAWAWYLLSPNWAEFWSSDSPASPYHDPDTLKAIIVMTDGEFNQRYELGNGSSTSQAQSLCQNIKSKGVMIFSVAFQAPPSAQDVLRNCATSPSQYFDAADGAELRATFQRIAKRLTALRLSS